MHDFTFWKPVDAITSGKCFEIYGMLTSPRRKEIGLKTACIAVAVGIISSLASSTVLSFIVISLAALYTFSYFTLDEFSKINREETVRYQAALKARFAGSSLSK